MLLLICTRVIQAPIPYRNNVIMRQHQRKRLENFAPIPYRNNVIATIPNEAKKTYLAPIPYRNNVIHSMDRRSE